MYDRAPAASTRRTEAERLIALAKELLTRPSEEIVVNYLDHALEALQIVAETEAGRFMPASDGLALRVPATVQAEGRG